MRRAAKKKGIARKRYNECGKQKKIKRKKAVREKSNVLT